MERAEVKNNNRCPIRLRKNRSRGVIAGRQMQRRKICLEATLAADIACLSTEPRSGQFGARNLWHWLRLNKTAFLASWLAPTVLRRKTR